MRHAVMVAIALVVGRAHAGPPPSDLVKTWKLSPRHAKHVDAGGMPVLASAKVNDFALREAAYLIDRMVGHRPEILKALAAKQVRFVVMAPSEMTTDVPEHADLAPKAYWDRRARGLGATLARPATSCGEENLLNLPGDPYSTENILVHELAHPIYEIAMAALDPTFDRRLRAAYDKAMAAKKWEHTYAATNVTEYWAEGTQSWFDTNRANDAQHGPVATRAQVVAYDPDLAALLKEVYGDRPWRYQRIGARAAGERAHLAGFDASRAGSFAWPRDPRVALSLDPMTSTSGHRATPDRTTPATSLTFANLRKLPVEVMWVNTEGRRIKYATVAPGAEYLQPTYEGHVWVVREPRGAELGITVAAARDGRVEIR
jgi:hypothetical protein